jgi:hypothetical protein
MPSSGNKSSMLINRNGNDIIYLGTLVLLQNDVSNYHGSSSVALDMNHLEQFRQQEQVVQVLHNLKI